MIIVITLPYFIEREAERIVQRRYYVTPSPCFTNSYMLDPHIVENNDKKG